MKTAKHAILEAKHKLNLVVCDAQTGKTKLGSGRCGPISFVRFA
jgi:hypothetical protein